jgi:hypothetical protein
MTKTHQVKEESKKKTEKEKLMIYAYEREA